MLPSDSLTVHITGKRPNFEVGSSSQLKLSINKTSSSVKPVVGGAVKLRTLSAKDVQDDSMGLIDSDELLDPEDLKKPDPGSLKLGREEKKAGSPVRSTPVVFQKNRKERGQRSRALSPCQPVQIATWAALSTAPTAPTLGC